MAREQPGAGESYVVFGRTQAFPAVFPLARLLPAFGGDGTDGFVLFGRNGGDFAGTSVSAAGDVNADGIDDLIVGARDAEIGHHSFAGVSYLVFGSKEGFPAELTVANLYPVHGGDGSQGVVISGIREGDVSGLPVSAVGDVNGDGVGDVVIGACFADPGGRNAAGESYVVFGRSAAP